MTIQQETLNALVAITYELAAIIALMIVFSIMWLLRKK